MAKSIPINSKRLKIAFITAVDSNNRKSLSGTSYFLSRLLNEYVGDVFYIDKLRPDKMTVKFLINNLFSEFTWIYLLNKLKQRFLLILGKKYEWERTIQVSKYYARKIEERLKGKEFDFIFADKASIGIAFLKTQISIIYHSDATFAVMIDYYPSFSNFTKVSLKMGQEIEKRALENSKIFICTSVWAKNSAIKDYGIPEENIFIQPLPANLDNVPSKEVVLREKPKDVCNLLFVGVDWYRKGGDIAVKTVEELNNIGVKAILWICGVEIPAKYKSIPYIKSFGFLDKNKPNEMQKLEELFLKAHFFILPTKAECLAQVFCEAAAYALPIVASDTGGVSSIVHEGINGFLFSVNCQGEDYGKRIKTTWEDEIRYNELRINSRRIYEEELSPEIWGNSIRKRLAEVGK